jgi:polyisoprenoid-binding protein YceI
VIKRNVQRKALLGFFTYFSLWVLLLFPMIVQAQIPSWKILPSESMLSFTATQNGAPVSGKFTQFSGDIKFDLANLKESSVKIVVETSSVSATYSELVDTLKMPEWFNVKLFPQAIFKANQFEKTGDKTYQAKGELTIRDKTLPTIINFHIENILTDTKIKVAGNTLLKRNLFGVGQGEWSSTGEVKDEVKVDFVLTVVKAGN